MALLEAGNEVAADNFFYLALSISSEMVKQVIVALEEDGVEFLVAPYEADAQMAYLALSGDVHAVISEDSDMLVYGCPRVGDWSEIKFCFIRCAPTVICVLFIQVLFKLDKIQAGQGEEIQIKDLQNSIFAGLTPDQFVQVWMMSTFFSLWLTSHAPSDLHHGWL